MYNRKNWAFQFIVLLTLTVCWGQYDDYTDRQHDRLPGEEQIEGDNYITWCTTSTFEQYKCQNLSLALQRDKALFGKEYIEFGCKQAFDTEECMTWVDNGEATLLALDAGEVYIGGRYHSLIPILQEVYEGNVPFEYSVAVTKKGGLPSVSTGMGLDGMRGAKACFPLVGTLAGWVLPIHTLMKQGGLKIIDCNNHIKSAIEYFGESCAINSLANIYNPIGDNSDKLCKLCKGGAGVRCTTADPYSGYVGALRCLLEKGDVAFLRHTTVVKALDAAGKMFGGVTADNLELVCTDGSRRGIHEWRRCNWGRAPADAVVTSSARPQHHRIRYQNFLQKLVMVYGDPNRKNSTALEDQDQFGNPVNRDQYGNPIYPKDEYGNPIYPKDEYGNPVRSDMGQRNDFGRQNYGRDEFGNPIYSSTQRYNPFDPFGRQTTSTSTPHAGVTDASGRPIESTFKLFDSLRHGTTDLMLQDATVSFKPLEEDQQRASHILNNPSVGDTAEKAVHGIRDCPVRKATLCVTSDQELDKCTKMRIALKAAFLSPALVCWRAHSSRLCEKMVAEGAADMVMLDAADMLHAASTHRLVPFMSEMYPTGHTWYYAVAVSKEQDPDTDITYLRGKNTCHTGIGHAAGWIYPLAYLISNGWIRSYGCDGARAAAEYFTKSCAPGALSSEYVDADSVPHDNLCHLCHGASFRRCRRDASEDYFGHVGAVRCMVEGGGDVAFVRHTAPIEVSGGRRREWWARDLLPDDMQLLCPDGTRAKIHEYRHCNLGKVPGSVMMGRANHTELDAFANLLVYAQQLYGAITSDDFSFSMFYSVPPYADLIFSDSAVALKRLAHHERSAEVVAGAALTRAARIVSCDAPQAGYYIGADPAFLSAGDDVGISLAVVPVVVSVFWVY